MNTELKPTQENILNTIKDNKLGRNATIKNFIKILYAMSEQNIISLNGDWGSGKTFFTKQLVEVIKCINIEDYYIDDNVLDLVQQIEKELEDVDIRNQLYPIYFNAWEYDSNEDPLLTLIYSIIEQNPNLKDNEKQAESMREKLYKIISSFKLGLSCSNNSGITYGMELQCNPKSRQLITKDVISLQELKSTFKNLLQEIIVEKTNKLVIFIDELDRCNPSFAIKLLERIKHFFDDDRFIFVFSTNLSELQYTVKKFYGEGINGYLYLDKFFDLQFSLPNIDIEKYINSLNIIRISNSRYFDICLKGIANIYKFSLRNCNRYMRLVSITYNFIRDTSDYGLAKSILFPILLGVKMNDINLFNKIISGNGEMEFKSIIMQSEGIIKTFNHYFQTEESETELTFDFTMLYKYIFINKKEIGWDEVKIGNVKVEYIQNRKILFDMLSFLNDFVIV